MITALDFKSISLNPFETRPVSVTGSVFSCLTSTGQFYLSFDGGPFIPFQGGLQVDNRPKLFTSIVLQNKTGQPLGLTFYCGTCAVTYSPVTIQVVTTNAATYVKGSVVAGPGQVTFSGQDNLAGVAKTRRQIIVANQATAALVVVMDATGTNAIGVVLPQTTWTLETSGPVTVLNQTATAAIIGETFYA
jgi:hypothetical protein